MDLGPEVSFSKFPTEVSVGDYSYFLVRDQKNNYRLLSAICPHQGGEVVDWGTCFMCPDHGWRFEYGAGECINGPNSRMVAFPVSLRDGHLFVDVPLP